MFWDCLFFKFTRSLPLPVVVMGFSIVFDLTVLAVIAPMADLVSLRVLMQSIRRGLKY